MRLALLFACAVTLSACAEGVTANDAAFVQPDLSGSLRIALSADREDGSSLRLRGAEFELSGSALLTLSDRDLRRSHESLVTRLPAGEYTVFLRPGWRMVERDANGSERESTSTELLSPNPTRLVVNEYGDESLVLRFRQGEREIRFGGGAVQVTRADQTAPRTTL
jgi:hypothetical protein